MILLGENINIMSKTLGPALKERQPESIAALAKVETTAGVDYIELNIGPAKKTGVELMPWLVEVIQGVTDTPLSLDTTNAEALDAALKVCKKRPLINSVSLQPERLEKNLPLVVKYHTLMVGLLWGVEGMPRDTNERAMLAVDLAYQANEAGVASEDIWIDPIVTPISGEIGQVKACVEFLQMLPEIAPGCKSIVGLSNVSNGAPADLRPYLNRTYMVMLMRYGLYAAIVDALDTELITMARGQRPQLINLIHRAMDGEAINVTELHPEDAKYVKSVRVLNGSTLYSDAWLET
jgi:5-methyltetrahydrofolate corrinoid/iron sulfur protein methyltransferase